MTDGNIVLRSYAASHLLLSLLAGCLGTFFLDSIAPFSLSTFYYYFGLYFVWLFYAAFIAVCIFHYAIVTTSRRNDYTSKFALVTALLVVMVSYLIFIISVLTHGFQNGLRNLYTSAEWLNPSIIRFLLFVSIFSWLAGLAVTLPHYFFYHRELRRSQRPPN